MVWQQNDSYSTFTLLLLRGHQEQHGTLSLFHSERFQIPGGRLRKFLQRPLHLLMWQGSIRYKVELSLLHQGLYVLSVCMYAYVRVAIYRNLKLNEWIQRHMYVYFKYAHVLKLFKIYVQCKLTQWTPHYLTPR